MSQRTIEGHIVVCIRGSLDLFPKFYGTDGGHFGFIPGAIALP